MPRVVLSSDEALFVTAYIAAGRPQVWPIADRRQAMRRTGRFSQPIETIPDAVLDAWFCKARQHYSREAARRRLA